MVLTAKKLRELGKYELAKKLHDIYDAELEKAYKTYTKAQKLHDKNAISSDKYTSAANRYCELFTEAYHFTND